MPRVRRWRASSATVFVARTSSSAAVCFGASSRSRQVGARRSAPGRQSKVWVIYWNGSAVGPRGAGGVAWASVGVFAALLLVRALEGFGETFYFPASMALTSDYHTPRTRSRALAFHQSSVYFGTILGSWLAAWFAERYGWRVGFYFFGGMGMVLALALYKFLREPQRGAAEAPNNKAGAHVVPAGEPLSIRETLQVIFRTPSVPLLMLAFVGANFVATIFLTWTPTFLLEKFHFKLTSAGLSGTAFIHLASACSVPVAGWLADRLSQRFVGGRILVQA